MCAETRRDKTLDKYLAVVRPARQDLQLWFGHRDLQSKRDFRNEEVPVVLGK